MSKIIIGCDPDSDKSGFAFYKECKLWHLSLKSTIEFYQFIEREFKHFNQCDIELHIENVAGTRTAFTAKKAKSLAGKLKVAQNIGQCKQSQLEIERVADYFSIKIVRHSLSSKWKSAKEKPEFIQLTGWDKKSNKDTRSAAYFGYIGVLKSKDHQCTT